MSGLIRECGLYLAICAAVLMVVVGKLCAPANNDAAACATTCVPQAAEVINGECWCRTRDDTFERAEVAP